MKVRMYYNNKQPEGRVFNFVVNDNTGKLVLYCIVEEKPAFHMIKHGRFHWISEYNSSDMLRTMTSYKREKYAKIGTLEVGIDHIIPNVKFYRFLTKLIKIKYDI